MVCCVLQRETFVSGEVAPDVSWVRESADRDGG